MAIAPRAGNCFKGRMPKTLVVIVNWNGWRDSIACIRSCLMLDRPVRIMLCDNDSADGSVDQILAWAKGESAPPDAAAPVPLDPGKRPDGVALMERAAAERGDDGGGAQLLIVRTGGNLGFAGGNNIGLRWALARDYDHAWLLNNDAVAAPDALSALVRAMEAQPAPGLAGSILLDFERPDRVQALAGAMRRKTFKARHLGTGLPAREAERADVAALLRPGEFLYPVGASMLVSRDFLTRVGPMREDYFLYHEEADWVLRGEGLFPLAIATDSRVYHHMGASTGFTENAMSRGAAGYLYRSRLLLARHFAPRNMPFVILRMLKDAAHAVRHGNGARAQGILRALLGRVRPPQG